MAIDMHDLLIEAPYNPTQPCIEGECRPQTVVTREALEKILKIPTGCRITHVEWDGACQILHVFYELMVSPKQAKAQEHCFECEQSYPCWSHKELDR